MWDPFPKSRIHIDFTDKKVRVGESVPRWFGHFLRVGLEYATLKSIFSVLFYCKLQIFCSRQPMLFCVEVTRQFYSKLFVDSRIWPIVLFPLLVIKVPKTKGQ